MLNKGDLTVAQFSAGRFPFHFGRELRVLLVGFAMEAAPLGITRRVLIESAVDVVGARRRARIELEIKRLIDAGFLSESGPLLTPGALFRRRPSII